MQRLFVAALAAMLLAVPASAQSKQDELKARQDALRSEYKKKLEKAFVKHAAWEQKIADAQAKAMAGGKLIFAYFTRSYQP